MCCGMDFIVRAVTRCNQCSLASYYLEGFTFTFTFPPHDRSGAVTDMTLCCEAQYFLRQSFSYLATVRSNVQTVVFFKGCRRVCLARETVQSKGGSGGSLSTPFMFVLTNRMERTENGTSLCTLDPAGKGASVGRRMMNVAIE